MDRGSTTAFQDEVVKEANRPVHLVEIHLDNQSDSATDEIVYINDSFKDITYSGNNYIGASSLLSFSDIEETVEVMVSKVTISLSGVDKVWIGKVLTKEYIDRTVKIYTAFLDSAYELISNPVLIFEGRIDQPTISEEWDSGKSIVSLSVTNAWVDFSRNTGRHTNNEEQQIFFAGDKGFEFASEIVKDITWGKA